ncbi:hypothetical protein Rhe02_38390 [Rhizocola hellebori]|uniref:DUF4352 domain-containing protein n=1 Tax=Rhizocola hellebori TaxID=1392758 RepID=A0A8J3VH18_9ACTN|nr:hypothetical protein [Rhizocola hellebori]GIH05772.1 hypothetical protein Rhe02_38390 [Rhizocola hellebori]
MKISRLVLAGALILGGCTANPSPHAVTEPSAAPAGPPIPVLAVGEAAPIDLLGDGHATITVLDAAIAAGQPLVVSVRITLDKAGKPIAGGPENFRFRDANQAMYEARTDAATFAPAFAQVNLTTAGQEAYGKMVFDVTPELARGGHVQLMTGRLVHAVWRL